MGGVDLRVTPPSDERSTLRKKRKGRGGERGELGMGGRKGGEREGRGEEGGGMEKEKKETFHLGHFGK